MGESSAPLKRFDVPLYCASWVPVTPAQVVSKIPDVKTGAESSQEAETPENELPKEAVQMSYVLSGGGGGVGRHGIRNRLILAGYMDDTSEITESLCDVDTEGDPPYRVAVHPNGEGVVVAFGQSCRLYELSKSESENYAIKQKPKPALEALARQNFVTFSADGSKLAAGGEDKHLRIFAWPQLSLLVEKEGAHQHSLKDADFSLDGSLLATTADEGPARVWDVEGNKAVASLLASPEKDNQVGKGKRRPRAKPGLCRFSRDPLLPLLFTTIIRDGRGLVAVWSVDTWQRIREVQLSADRICSLALSPNGLLLAAGTTDGDLLVASTKRLKVQQRVKEAHMVFVTALQFSPSSRELLSVSGDSSMRIMVVTPSRSVGGYFSHGNLHGVASFICLVIAFAGFFVLVVMLLLGLTSK